MKYERYVSKRVVVEAIQFDGDNAKEIAAWAGNGAILSVSAGLVVKTLEGDMFAPPSSWIVRGLAGEFYPVKDSVFQAKYEPETAE